MKMLADAGAIFLGQGIVANGIAWTPDFEDVPLGQRIEFPIAEEMNVGAALGMSLAGCLPVVCIPRFDFLLRAADQIVNHLDKLETMSVGQYRPKVIIRTQVGKRTPLDAGPQHTNDHTEAFRLMFTGRQEACGWVTTNVAVREIRTPEMIPVAYAAALASERSSLVVEAL